MSNTRRMVGRESPMVLVPDTGSFSCRNMLYRHVYARYAIYKPRPGLAELFFL